MTIYSDSSSSSSSSDDSSPPVSPASKVQKAQDALDKLIRKELDAEWAASIVAGRTPSHATFLILYIQAISQLRPTFFENEADYLDEDMRIAQWDKRDRFNRLKKRWMRYDKIAPDKGQLAQEEDRKMEKDLDAVEKDVQEEWHEFAEELLDVLEDQEEEDDEDDEDDDEDDQDDEDKDDDAEGKKGGKRGWNELEKWRKEVNNMKVILHLPPRSRSTEDEEEEGVGMEDEAKRKKERKDKTRRSKKKETEQGETDSTALSPKKKNKKKSSVEELDEENDTKRKSKKKKSRKKSHSGKSRTNKEKDQGHDSDSDSDTSSSSDSSKKDRKKSRKGKSRRKERKNQSGDGDSDSSSSIKNEGEEIRRDENYIRDDKEAKRKKSKKRTSESKEEGSSSSGLVLDGNGKKYIAKPKQTQPEIVTTRISYADLTKVLETLAAYKTQLEEDLIKALRLFHDHARGNYETRQDFGSNNGNVFLADTLKFYLKKHVHVTEACYVIMVPLVECVPNRDELVTLGVIETVLEGMLHHQDRKNVQEYGCKVISGIAVTDKYKEKIVASNGIQTLLKTQALFVLDGQVQATCLRCLTQIVIDNPEYIQLMAAEGGVKALVKTVGMAEHFTNLQFQRVALRAITILTKDDEANRVSITEEDGIWSILLVMESLGFDEEVQQHACEALFAIATKHAENCAIINTQGGPRIISKGMKYHVLSEGVQQGGLSVLRLITKDDAVATKFGSVGGVELVIESMRNFENITIQEHGCLTLCNMAMQEGNKETIVNLGGVQMIVSVMKLLKENSSLQKRCCRALESLATKKENKATIAAGGAIDAVKSAMKNHSESATVQALAITVLLKLVTVSRNRKIMQKKKVGQLVELATQNFPDNTNLQDCGKELLQILADPTFVIDEDAQSGKNA
eukprot:scaffold4545_cov139-Amphora_coffeaeformis.AAC.6